MWENDIVMKHERKWLILIIYRNGNIEEIASQNEKKAFCISANTNVPTIAHYHLHDCNIAVKQQLAV